MTPKAYCILIPSLPAQDSPLNPAQQLPANASRDSPPFLRSPSSRAWRGQLRKDSRTRNWMCPPPYKYPRACVTALPCPLPPTHSKPPPLGHILASLDTHGPTGLIPTLRQVLGALQASFTTFGGSRWKKAGRCQLPAASAASHQLGNPGQMVWPVALVISQRDMVETNLRVQ